MKAGLYAVGAQRSTYRKATDFVSRNINPWLVFGSAIATLATFGAQLYVAKKRKDGSSK